MKTDESKISAETLRDWLEEGKEITVLDVRPQDQREEWSIPGSVYIDAYEKLKQHQTNALAGIKIPGDVPVVTVCAAGKTSKIAADLLKQNGQEVYSLEGGMKAWTLAWNTAVLKDGELTILQVRRTGKGCLSYIIASEGEAIVIDASVDVEVYLNLAQKNDWKIKYVLDTHLHADHLSRSPALAHTIGVPLYMPEQDKLVFPYNKFRDGDILEFGKFKLKAIHTPGHTMDSTTYIINKKFLFTGDTLFTDGVGRPDLKANQEQAKLRASLLYNSLQKLAGFSNETIVFPGHLSKPIPFDQKIISSPLGEIKRKITSLNLPEEEFVNNLISKIPPTPPNYFKVNEINKKGNIDGVDPKEIEAGANRCAIS
jgi:glyoxylase-like metal-dependent hydrolase (beta-lactamase superfamily II)/rhodanese-related sulfurtransferase